jgi:hypothetical protein
VAAASKGLNRRHADDQSAQATKKVATRKPSGKRMGRPSRRAEGRHAKGKRGKRATQSAEFTRGGSKDSQWVSDEEDSEAGERRRVKSKKDRRSKLLVEDQASVIARFNEAND